LILANKGYDVWLGNTRGNSYTNIPKLDQWNFTFDQMAEYDVPASLEYINRMTNKQIHYVGHSQGTLVMFIGLS
jgi:predicted alpha/beta hydrolase